MRNSNHKTIAQSRKCGCQKRSANHKQPVEIITFAKYLSNLTWYNVGTLIKKILTENFVLSGILLQIKLSMELTEHSCKMNQRLMT